ncbi:uncharacterized protein BJ171DRAFT_457544 [Polychytrium aggregatum]|uniref:uncharacterized protein n=1 Tax=Polychytrium aggregatum TaxID=110093 RepID=UPI0022FE9E6A|nr:uncharacterized protein BJ171DRAFT_457544 [Polychytrium aggregatum]KAI9206505.1 hypothetical protein BJ171DRAFT_457544 [Polychytrium aggregatum]
MSLLPGSQHASAFDFDSGLATLCSLFEEATPSELAKVLTKHRGSVDAAIDAILSSDRSAPTAAPRLAGLKRRRDTARIDQFLVKRPRNSGSEPDSPPVAAPEPDRVHDGSEQPADRRGHPDAAGRMDAPMDDSLPPVVLPNALSMLRWQPQARAQKPILVTAKNIHEHVPCVLFLNFLDSGLAETLLASLLEESKGYEHGRFVLANKVVESPHLTASYLDAERNTYDPSIPWYDSGRRKTMRYFNPDMQLVRELVEQKVNQVLEERDQASPTGRHPDEHPGPWQANIALVNAYRGAAEGVGPHTDRLTILGPRATIASLSLGCGRVFRLQRVGRPGVLHQTYNVVLPHNSLLMMLPTTQEEYKHSIPSNVDPVIPHAIARTTRINITYRMARPIYQRSIPVCKCGIQTDLRPVVRSEKTFGRYFYSCPASQTAAESEPFDTEEKIYVGLKDMDKYSSDLIGNRGKIRVVGCGFFEWLDTESINERVRQELDQTQPKTRATMSDKSPPRCDTGRTMDSDTG